MLHNQDKCDLLFGGTEEWLARCYAAVCRSVNTLSLQDMPIDLVTYVSQMKYYERMHKVKEREQHVQEVRCCAMPGQHNAVSGLYKACKIKHSYCTVWREGKKFPTSAVASILRYYVQCAGKCGLPVYSRLKRHVGRLQGHCVMVPAGVEPTYCSLTMHCWLLTGA